MKRRLFKTIAISLILTLTATSGVFAAVPSDVKGQNYEAAVSALVEKGIITGDTDGKFHPEDTLTRAQACVIVVKSMNPPAAEVTGTATQTVSKSGFKDMGGYGWAEGYISYAVKNNVTKGYPDGTFKPGSKVTMNELITMVLRAADVTDESLGGVWPANYINKATELQILTNIPSPMPTLATKWMAAQVDFNALDKIAAANPALPTPPQGTDQDKPSAVPDTANMKFTSGVFSSTMDSFAGKAIAKNVTVYTYGKTANYKSDMTFSKNASDYRMDTIYKFKNATTPAFYSMKGNEINAIVLPMDSGYSGRAYGVINGVVNTLNGDGESVQALETLIATRNITWLGTKGLSGIPTSAGDGKGYLDGTVYEIKLSNGAVKGIAASTDSSKSEEDFKELSSNTSSFVEVVSMDENVVKLTDGSMFSVKDNASVYVMDKKDRSEYKAGSLGSIREGVMIRAYDIGNDKETSADVVVVMK